MNFEAILLILNLDKEHVKYYHQLMHLLHFLKPEL